MTAEIQIRRAQVYHFLSGAFLYPEENWLEDLPQLSAILAELEFEPPSPPPVETGLEELQSGYRHSVGLSGSLPYETEIGMPNEFSQSQELADIAGFYHAFGFQVGGTVRERPDYLATELEFMGLLALKQAYAEQQSSEDHALICTQAQRTFLQDHLGRWIGLVAQAVAITAGKNGGSHSQEEPYVFLARLAADFVAADASRLGVALNTVPLNRITPTPPAPELSCEACPAAC